MNIGESNETHNAGLDCIKLARVLQMTQPDHAGETNGEATAAIGIANRMLKTAGLTWPELLADRDRGSPMITALFERNAALDAENRRLHARLAKFTEPRKSPPKPKRKPRRKKVDDGRAGLISICDGIIELGAVVVKPWPIKFATELKDQLERGGGISINQRAKLLELRDAWLSEARS